MQHKPNSIQDLAKSILEDKSKDREDLKFAKKQARRAKK